LISWVALLAPFWGALRQQSVALPLHGNTCAARPWTEAV
jgi:hypothetical protein